MKYTKPKQISPFFGDVRIPRKLKKDVKKFCGIHWCNLENGQRLWFYMEKDKMEYKKFLINIICKNENYETNSKRRNL